MRGEGGAHKTFFRENRCLSFYIRLPSLQPPPPLVQCDQLRMAFSPLASPIPPTARLLFPRRRRESGFPPFYFLPLPFLPSQIYGKGSSEGGEGGEDLFPPLSPPPLPQLLSGAFG